MSKVILCQYGLGPNLFPKCTGWSRKEYGRAVWNMPNRCHELPMTLEQYEAARADIGKNLGRAGCNWIAKFVPDAPESRDETIARLQADLNEAQASLALLARSGPATFTAEELDRAQVILIEAKRVEPFKPKFGRGQYPRVKKALEAAPAGA